MLSPPFNAGRTQYLANLLPIAQIVNLTATLAHPVGNAAPFTMECWTDSEEAENGPDWVVTKVSPTVLSPGHLSFPIPATSLHPRVCELYYFDHLEHPLQPHSLRYLFLLSPFADLSAADLAKRARSGSGGSGGGGSWGLSLLALLAGGTGVAAIGMQLSQWSQGNHRRAARDHLVNDYGLGVQPLGDSEYTSL